MARREFALDLTRYHARYLHGDMTVFATWFGNNLTACLVIVPSYYEGHDKVTPCIVPINQAFEWSEAVGDGAHCAFVASQFCKHLRMTPSMDANIRITSLIREHLGDLLSIPPAPFESVVVADAFRIDNRGKEHHSEIRDRV